MLAKRMMWIAWPAFLFAGLLEMLVFGLVDPQDLQWFGHPLAVSRQGVYTLAFFVFWALGMLSSGLTLLLSLSPIEVNRHPVPPEQGTMEGISSPDEIGADTVRDASR